ncbi:MAG: LPXTG cell wall anchor domain-containing protein [Ruminococcus sp.]|nr:LPXTG cell wall anchor domain-containing protein [Ruminococcus sp.]
MKKTSRTFKRFAAITSASLLAACMVAPMAGSAVVKETEIKSANITIENTVSGHEYEAYQIFKGTLLKSVDDNNTEDITTDDNTTVTFTDVNWGDNVIESPALYTALAEIENADGDAVFVDENGANLTTAAKVAEKLQGASSDVTKAFAATMNKHLNSTGVQTLTENKTGEGEDTTTTGYTLTSTKPGYYLIKDKDGSLANEEDTYTSFIVQVLGDVSIAPKSGMVEFKKKIKDTNDSTGVTSDWQDSGDYDIGDKIPFQLTGKVAGDYDAYKVYQFVFHDEECEGLTFKRDSVVVKVDGTKIESGYEIVEAPSDDCSFEIKFADLKQIGSVQAGSVITVEYESELNASADIGLPGNPNTSYLTFSNNPNNETGTEIGKTVDDTVIAFTYQTVINKVDENNNALIGANFKLEKKEIVDGTTTWVEVTRKTGDATGSKFTFTGLDDGDYKLTETATPPGYNSINPIEFTITAEHEILSDNPTLTSLMGGDLVTGEFKDTGVITQSIQNNAGSVLPGTGGIGTTVFYLGGGAMVAVAGIYLISKKRMKNTQE